MWSPGATGAILLLVILGLLALEWYTLTNDVPNDHITAVVRRATKKTALLPFLLGMLMGHFFFCG